MSIQVICNNAYLIPWFYVEYLKFLGDSFYVSTCTNQKERSILLAELCSKKDIVILQEMWGAGAHNLQKKLTQDFSIQSRSKCSEGFFCEIFNTYDYNRTKKNGGLYFACKKEFSIVWEYHHVFVNCNGEEGMNKSAGFVLLDVGSKWGHGKYLLTINTHLSSPLPFDDTVERKQQKKEILEQIKRLQLEMKYPEDFQWENCGVLLLGDFNMAYKERDSDSLTKEYLETVNEIFGVILRDLYLESHPNSNTPTYDGVNNPYAMNKIDTSRMDYVFAMDEIPSHEGNTTIKTLRLGSKCDILTHEEQPNGLVSDHYPYTFEIFLEN